MLFQFQILANCNWIDTLLTFGKDNASTVGKPSPNDLKMSAFWEEAFQNASINLPFFVRPRSLLYNPSGSRRSYSDRSNVRSIDLPLTHDIQEPHLRLDNQSTSARSSSPVRSENRRKSWSVAGLFPRRHSSLLETHHQHSLHHAWSVLLLRHPMH